MPEKKILIFWKRNWGNAHVGYRYRHRRTTIHFADRVKEYVGFDYSEE